MSCAIDQNFLFVCATPPVAGVYDYILLYNYDEFRTMIDNGLVTYAVDGSIDSIANSVGVQAFRYDVPDATALIPTYPNRKVAGGINGFDHLLNFSIIGNEQAQKNAVNAMNLSRVVALYMCKNGNGEILGIDQGLDMVGNTANINDKDLGSVIPVQLATGETSAERKPPLSIFDTDAATTKALIDGLTTVGV